MLIEATIISNTFYNFSKVHFLSKLPTFSFLWVIPAFFQLSKLEIKMSPWTIYQCPSPIVCHTPLFISSKYPQDWVIFINSAITSAQVWSLWITPTAAWYSCMLPDCFLPNLQYHCWSDFPKHFLHHVTPHSRIYSGTKFKVVNELIPSHLCNTILHVFLAFFSTPRALFNVSLINQAVSPIYAIAFYSPNLTKPFPIALQNI